MSKSQTQKIVENTEKITQSISEAASNQDYSKVPEAAISLKAEVTREQKSNARRIEPKWRMKVKTTRAPTEEEKKYHAYMWEYVEGVFENREILGESKPFWINPFPGDDYAEWTIPANVPISIPRWCAKHLSERKYVKFKYREKAHEQLTEDSFTNEFIPGEVCHRTSFMSTRAY